MNKLLGENKLPALQSLVGRGGLLDLNLRGARAVTKVGWSEVFTGYNASGSLGIMDNIFYKPIPKGLTIFEKIKNNFKKL